MYKNRPPKGGAAVLVGNDIVDLTDRETATAAQHPRFDRRVFGPVELALIERGNEPRRMRWLLWAAKESALKVARKLDDRTEFSPRRFIVTVGNRDTGWVSHCGRRYPFRIDRSDDLLHVVAADNIAVLRSAFAGLSYLDESARRTGSAGVAVRRLAIDAVAARLKCLPGEISIVTEPRIPHVLRDGRRAPVDISLSHHGRAVAFAAVPWHHEPLCT